MQKLPCECVFVRVCVFCLCYMLLYSLKSRPRLLLPFLLIRTSARGRRDGERGGQEGREEEEEQKV